MYKIENSFTNSKGVTYEGLRTISASRISDLPIGKLLVYTNDYDKNNYFIDTEFKLNDGVMINQSILDSKKALRIYKDWANAWYYNKSDDSLVYELQKKQNKIKLTEFPIGIVTISNFPFDITKSNKQRIIGQEIIYYENSIALGELLERNPNINQISIYIEMLNILKELLNNGIFYDDIHGGNFVINKEYNKVRLIDFEPGRIKIDDIGPKELRYTFQVLRNLIKYLSQYSKYELNSDIDKTSNLNELEEYLHDNQKIKH